MGYLLAITLVFAYAAVAHGATQPKDWTICLAIVAAARLIFWLRTPRPAGRRPVEAWITWCGVSILLFAAVQLTPLPAGLLALLSPERAHLICDGRVLVPEAAFAPITLSQTATLEQFARITGYALVFVLARLLASRYSTDPWKLALPVIAIACVEAAIGIAQYLAAPDSGYARGPYVNRNHFANLLAVSLPFGLMAAVNRMRSAVSRRPPSGPAAFEGGVYACAALLIIAAIICSLSRMGLLAAAAGVLTAVLLVLKSLPAAGIHRIGIVVVFVTACGLCICLFPERLFARFGSLFAQDLSLNARLGYWRDTLSIIRHYPLLGSGLGTYEIAIAGYRRSDISEPLDHAHNDYLEILAEGGAAGALLVMAFTCRILGRAFRAALLDSDNRRREFCIAGSAALVALLAHSAADYSLQIPANAMLAAWIAGAVSRSTRSAVAPP